LGKKRRDSRSRGGKGPVNKPKRRVEKKKKNWKECNFDPEGQSTGCTAKRDSLKEQRSNRNGTQNTNPPQQQQPKTLSPED